MNKTNILGQLKPYIMILLPFIGGLIGFVIGAIITAYIFKSVLETDSIITMTSKQYAILRQIADKLGVEPHLIEEIDDPVAYRRKNKK
jgi:hypothetical protein